MARLWLSLLLSFIILATRSLAQYDLHCMDGRTGMVQLFEWKWRDVELECANYLGPQGFCAVQVSPPNEHVMVEEGAVKRPWWERYEPVSYGLSSRSGDARSFIKMVTSCNQNGVRVIVDVVLNHMANEKRKGKGIGGTEYDSTIFFFPGVSFGNSAFHDCSSCPACCCIESNNSIDEIRNCRSEGRLDLNQRKDFVLETQVQFLKRLVDSGVAGFRFDCAHNMWPLDLFKLQSRLGNLNTVYFPFNSRAAIITEVLDESGAGVVNASEYGRFSRVADYKYTARISEALNDLSLFPKLVAESESKSVVFVDNHYTQRGQRLPKGSKHLDFTAPRTYRMAQALTLAGSQALPTVMSSYRFKNADDGPPSDDTDVTRDVITPGGNCSDGWMCEHRWATTRAMIGFRNHVAGTDVKAWWSPEGGKSKLAFSRDDRGFFAITTDESLNARIPSRLPPGVYCNILKGSLVDGACTGESVTVDTYSRVQVTLDDTDIPFLAIHTGAMIPEYDTTAVTGDTTPSSMTTALPTAKPIMTSDTTRLETESPPEESTTGDEMWTTVPIAVTATTDATITASPNTAAPSAGTRSSTVTPTTTHPKSTVPARDIRRTVLFIDYQTRPGQAVFYRGGIDHARRAGCEEGKRNAETNPCAISIRHNTIGRSSHYWPYNEWKRGDTKLDWYGPQRGQGTYEGAPAEGTPSVWTTNERWHEGYNPLNRWGRGHWMVDFDMDCAETIDGWFEFRGHMNGGIGAEPPIYQNIACTGDAGGYHALRGKLTNHIARCGFINKYFWRIATCEIYRFPSATNATVRQQRTTP